jgi:transposase InsO family protein
MLLLSPIDSQVLLNKAQINAVVESFFHTLKTEYMDEKRYSTRDGARIDVIDYI